MLDARLRPPDLLVTDIRLPGMNGMDLIQKLRDRSPKIRYIVITALSEAEYRLKARQLGVRAYFQKPMELADFLSAVTAALEVKESEFDTSDLKPKDQPRAALKSEQPQKPSISQLLANLREDIQAQAAILIDDHGRVTGQAGDFPENDFEQRWIPVLLASHSTHDRVARMMGEQYPHSLQVFSGQQFDLFIAPVGDFALVLVFGVGSISNHVAEVYAKALDAQKSLVEAFGLLGVHFQKSNQTVHSVEVAADPAQDVENLDELAALLANPGEVLRAEDAEAFWQQTDENLDVTSHSLPDAISFEQARQLGLIPEEAESTE